MSLKDELKDISQDKVPTSRCDLSTTRHFFRSYPSLARVIGLFFIISGVASIAGLLRWQEPFMAWSFALLCWGGAAYAFWCAQRPLNG